MIVDFRRNTPALPPLTIMNSTAPTVESFRFLGTTISQDLKWDTHIDSIIKKAQQRLYFLRQLRKFNLPQELLTQFYSAVIESVLYTSITVWFGSATKSDIKRLQRTSEEKGSEKSLWTPHIQAISFLTFCHLTEDSQDSQAQEQFLPPSNLPFEQLNVANIFYTYHRLNMTKSSVVLQWSFQSLDLNPVELLWDVVEIYSIKVHLKNLQEFCDEIMSR
ncbi:hypothetical protein QTP86_032867 [Hemibagrus guttatus]|nr:hypothetical protein QTP86_032867 [Hemibagrus guttatus]